MLSQRRLTALFFLANLICYSSQQTPSGSPCDESGDAIKFEQGKTYRYEFSSVTTQHMRHGLGDGVSNLVINGEAILTKAAPCEYILSLEKLGISNRDSKSATIPANFSSSTVKFTRRNGVVSEFFISENDETWLVNIKRVIISMLQNKVFSSETASTTMEMSVFGNCPTSHFKNDEKYIKVINLNHCAQRETMPNANLGVPYEVTAGHKSHTLQVLNSTLFCEQVVSSGIIQSSTCSEENKLLLKHRHNHPTATLVQSSLKLTGTEAKYTAEEITKMNENIKQASNILFDQGRKSGKVMNNGNSEVSTRIKDILTRLSTENVKQAEYYIELLDAMLELENPMELYSGKDFVFSQKAKLLFIDAAAETDTPAALLFISNLIQADSTSVTSLTKLKFYKRISFSANPTVEGVDSLESLIRTRVIGSTTKNGERDLDSNLLLGASGYANQYCVLAGCAESPSLNKLSETISSYVIDSGIANENSGNAIIPALHALGNIQKLSVGAVSKILIYLGDAQEDWVKIIAMQAFRNDPCQKDLKEKVKSILGMNTASADLRINAYLALSKCLTAEDVPVIDAVFKDKESAPVGRFIMSHVRNIKESSSPSKSKLKNSLAQITMPDKLDAPMESMFRNSIYHEYSHFDEENNVGVSAGATIIFGKMSNIPLAVTLDVTIDAIGRSYNIFEGTLSRRTIKEDSGDSMESMYNQLMLLLESGQRNDAYLRLFGLTRYVGDVRDATSPVVSLVRQAMQDMQLTSSGMEVTRVLPLTFVNAEISYPSVSGFPLSLDLQAIAVHSLTVNNVSGSIGYLALQTDPFGSSTDMSMDILRLDSFSFKGAMRVGRVNFTPMNIGIIKEYSLDSVWDLGLNLNKEKMSKIHLKIRLPKKDFATFSFNKHTFFYEDIDGAFSKVPFSKLNPNYNMDYVPKPTCENFVEKATGVLLCGFLRFPSNNIDRNSLQYNLTLRKSEDNMEAFVINADVDYNHYGNDSMSLVLDTPGSSISRKISVQYKFEVYPPSSGERTYESLRNLQVTSPYENITATVVDKYHEASGDVPGVHTLETSLTLGDSGTYRLNYKNNESDYANGPAPLEWLSLYRLEYGLDIQLIYPNELVMFSFQDHLSQRNAKESNLANIAYSVSVGGKFMEDMGMDSSAQSTFVYDKGETQDTMNFDVGLQNKNMGKSNLKIYYNTSRPDFSDMYFGSSLQLGDTTYMYTSSVRENVVANTETNVVESKKIVFNSSYTVSPGDISETLDAIYSYGTLPNGTKYFEADATLVHAHMGKFDIKTEYKENGLTTTGLILFDEQGENVGKLQAELIAEENKKWFIVIFLRNLLEFKSTAEISGTSFSSDTQGRYIPDNIWANHTCKANSQGDLVTEHSDTVWGHAQTTRGTVATDTNVNTATRTLESKSVYTLDGKTNTVTTNATLAENIFNGHSGAIITVVLPTGENIREILELDTVENPEAQTNSATLHLLVEDTAGRSTMEPLEVTSKTTFNWKNTQPEKMLYTYSVTNDLKYNKGCPQIGDKMCQDLHMISEIDTSQTKYAPEETATVTILAGWKTEGNIMRGDVKGSVEVLVPPSSDIWSHGLVRVNGSSEYPNIRNNIAAALKYDHEYGDISTFQKFMDVGFSRQYYTTFILTGTDLQSGTTTTILDLEANSTRVVKSLLDFEIKETGKMTCSGNTTKWTEVIRMHDNEFLFLYDIVQDENTLVFMEVTIKMREENEQMKLDFNSKNNFDDKSSNFNFTLTR